ncbi:hypothetical protein D9M73_290360 [compost metagenome]
MVRLTVAIGRAEPVAWITAQPKAVSISVARKPPWAMFSGLRCCGRIRAPRIPRSESRYMPVHCRTNPEARTIGSKPGGGLSSA